MSYTVVNKFKSTKLMPDKGLYRYSRQIFDSKKVVLRIFRFSWMYQVDSKD